MNNTHDFAAELWGRAAAFESYALNTMWKKYGELNGYRTKESFKEAIAKVSKEHKISVAV